MLQIGRHCEETPFLVAMMVGDLVQINALAVIRDVLTDHTALWSDAQLTNLAHKVAASRIDWNRGFDGESMSFYDCMQRLYTDNGQGDGRLAYRVSDEMNVFQMIDAVTNTLASSPTASAFNNSGLAMMTLPAANMVVASRKEMLDAYDTITDHARAQVNEPLWQLDAEVSTDSELQAIKRDTLTKFRYCFIDLLLPAYDAIHNAVVKSDGARDGVLLGLALELCHRQNKQWPATLAELSPQFLPELPVDRITGKPLRYQIVDDRPVIYSVGVDEDDDGGRLPAECADDAESYLLQVAQHFIDPNQPSPPTERLDGDWFIWSTLKSN
jgi:hypothetical protein